MPHFGVDNFISPYLSPVFVMEKIEQVVLVDCFRNEDFVYITDNTYSKDELLQMECNMLLLGFEDMLVRNDYLTVTQAVCTYSCCCGWKILNTFFYEILFKLDYSIYIILHIDWYWVVSRRLWTAIIIRLKWLLSTIKSATMVTHSQLQDVVHKPLWPPNSGSHQGTD